jgi:hypothetical protein
MKRSLPLLAALLSLVLIPVSRAAELIAPDQARLEALQARFAPVDVGADTSKLSEGDRHALENLIRAGQILDGLFLRQDWAGSETMLLRLLDDPTPLGRARLSLFLTMKGPWDRTDGNKPFIPGAPAKPAEANFYPAGATKDEVEKWIATLSDSEKAQATGFFTTIRRGPDGKFVVVPYSTEYQGELKLAADLLKDAAAATTNASLKAYLEKRAAAFSSNDYYASDVAWMELDAPIEPTVGPYENYEDDWFNYKAAFESFIGLRDDAESAKLQSLSSQLQWLEDNLPIKPSLRNPKLGALAPIRVINQVYASGDAAHGVTTAAFNLPNDEKVTREKGSKRTMLKNVQEAKFRVVLVPLAKLAVPPGDVAKVDFDAFFTHILMHELMHGLGPHTITGPDGKPTTVRQALQESSSAFEEAKADISGLWALQKLIDKRILDPKLQRTIYTTFVASGFRTLRFGASEAHGKGMAMQLNYLIDRGGVVINKDGTFSVNDKLIFGAVASLTKEIMEIQARGDHAAAKSMLEKLGTLRPEMAKVLENARNLPIDIAPRHVTAEALLK